jgi:8-oxo-dGTP pyrophosphatase MutT (NUDIX family)
MNPTLQEKNYHLGIKALIQNSDGKILILRRTGHNFWDVPGGRVQTGEQALETLVREVMEETGLSDLRDIKPQAMTLTPITIQVTDGTSAGLILWYHSCTVVDPVIALSEEHCEYQWVTWDVAQTLVRFFGAASLINLPEILFMTHKTNNTRAQTTAK